jgi:hypothetical protein
VRKAKPIVIAILLCCVPAGFIFAATLDELHKPLLDQGRWRADAETEFIYAGLFDRSDPFTSPATYSDYDYWYFLLDPAIYYGLTDKLQLKLSTEFTIPFNYDYTQYQEGTGPLSSTKSTAKYNNYLSETITWRPQESWEFSFSPSQEFIKTRQDDYNYAAGELDRSRSKYSLYSVMAAATWLSAPQAGNKTAANRPDLDGLLNPLLDEGQIKISLPLGYLLYDGDTRQDTEEAAPSVDWQAGDIKMPSFYIRPAFFYGIKDNLEMDLNFYWYPPSVNGNKMLTYLYSYNGVNVNEAYISTKSKELTHLTPQATLTHRLNSQLQWYATGYYDYDTSRSNYGYQTYTNGALGVDTNSENKFKYSVISGAVGFTWISLPEKSGEKLSANLDGLKNPLLEQRQLRLDFSYTATRNRSDSATSASTRDDYNTFYAKVTYGLMDMLQAYFSTHFTLTHAYLYDSTPTSIYKYIYPFENYFGAGLTYRPRQDFELYLTSIIRPWDDSRTEHFGAAGLDSISYSEDPYATLTIGATILW